VPVHPLGEQVVADGDHAAPADERYSPSRRQ
jgi:hypothetical protein